MNSIISLELELLTNLRAELSEYEITSDVRADVSGLAVATNVPGLYAWVFVSFTGRYFSWSGAEYQHPIADIPGAARRIAAHVSKLRLVDADDDEH